MRPARTASLAALLTVCHGLAWAGQPLDTASVVRNFAQLSLDNGAAVGIAVAVVSGDNPAQLFTYGYADRNAGAAVPLTTRSRFQIASVTKVFTTEVLGQEISDGTLGLQDTLGDFSAQTGRLQPAMAAATLEELGDFTAGLPSYAPPCVNNLPPGCLPPDSRNLETYDARAFLDFFRHTVPMDYQKTPPAPVRNLPAPYNYSDFSIGLLGLLLDPLPGTPLTDGSLDRWFRTVHARLLAPLGLHDTFLNAPTPPNRTVPIALGYTLALGTPVVSNHQVTKVTLRNEGLGYDTAPAVQIVGGGGSGATVSATVLHGQVTGLEVTSPGTGYLAPPTVMFSSDGQQTPPTAHAIVRGGRVVAIEVNQPGSGYTTAPTVTISGGQQLGGVAATATAQVAAGGVTYVQVTAGGSGYVQPIAVAIAPGTGFLNGIPIWGAAGSLSSDILDLSRFTAAALGETRIGTLTVPSSVAAGFRIAETAYACDSATSPDPALASCRRTSPRSALAWNIEPADLADRYPAIIGKDGFFNGFYSQVFLVPQRHLAVAVLMNSYESAATAAPGVAAPDAEGITATTLARNILNALLYQPGIQ